MKTSKLILATLMLTGTASFAVGQESSNKPMEMAPVTLPAQCGEAADQKMPMTDRSGMDMSGMDEAHKAFMAGMIRMQPAMMRGIMAKDPDVAFVCTMIAHHQGAIDMASVELKYGDNDEAKQAAQKIIDDQTKEIADFKKWLEANVK
ncbi:DUF305 domain-containing protein [Mesorhizobium sp. J428]|uniref:DUF305 domain-containing protein n=1 Tax=Mesorhizobium sp. J428 TaxID=2898440 RepID=UPI002150D232|nr:DUF305 domain-containing protein [Mesorhizobium sp. J428]MCR5860476.1 DUF305 domain-containing protein [Mesorhizobium sp. J428]MCR5860629.1 DUF305 domain-containing protein [Mesorhizobium sp. J428]